MESLNEILILLNKERIHYRTLKNFGGYDSAIRESLERIANLTFQMLDLTQNKKAEEKC